MMSHHELNAENAMDAQGDIFLQKGRALRTLCVLGVLCVEIVSWNVTAQAQTQKPAAPPSASETVAAPIECWWKTDRSAVRVGEPFELTLTCAVVDTDLVKVVVDESSLAPTALHLVPFEVIGGNRFRDIRNSPRRFFQYRYVMRVLGEDFFGKEVTLPKLELTYRVQNAVGGGTALSGREEQYSLRQVPIRVLSIVPRDAGDIRDAPSDTFGDIDSRMFTSNILLIAAGVALGFAVLMAVLLLVRATVARRSVAARRASTVSSNRVLWAASRELGAVRTASGQEGWTGELAGRAAAALRLAGAVALSRPISQRRVDRGTEPGEGQVALGRWLAGKKVMLSAAVTPGGAPRNGKADALWDGVSQSLSVFSAVRYSRNGTPDGVALDSALADAQDVVKRLQVRQLMRMGRTRVAAAEPGKQSWAR
jgi:hypothetical protein